jgi:hypothetical protein
MKLIFFFSLVYGRKNIPVTKSMYQRLFSFQVSKYLLGGELSKIEFSYTSFFFPGVSLHLDCLITFS